MTFVDYFFTLLALILLLSFCLLPLALLVALIRYLWRKGSKH